MTINITAFADYVPAGKKLQVVRRHPTTGLEEVLSDGVTANTVARACFWAECELVFREVDVVATAVDAVEPDAPLSAEG